MEYGLLGEHLSHSFSKQIHDMLGAYSYELYPTPREALPALLKDRQFKGLNVTIPYKKDVIPYLDVVDDLAARIGAVNTIYFRNGKMHGTNTDYTGFLYMANRCGISFTNQRVLIMGTGGASLMAQRAAADRGAAAVLVAGRKGPIRYDQLPRDIDILVNTTPLGTYPGNGQQAADLSSFNHLQGVLDLIYNPDKSALLLQAESHGVPFSGGLPMLVAQATAAAEYFTGREDFHQENERIIRAIRRQNRNITLVGMPGCGKTTIGKKLTETLDMSFVDTDHLLEQENEMPAGDIIRTRGEDAFRNLEEQLLARVTAEHGQVIATGGGAVLRPENRQSMRQNGPVIFLERDLSQLPTEGRPLSHHLDEMYRKRLPLYRRCSDIIVSNNGIPETTLAAILPALEESPGNI